MTSITPSAGTLYWRPITDPGPWIPAGETCGMEPVAPVGGFEIVRENDGGDLRKLWSSGTITMTVQLDNQFAQAMHRMFRELRRRQLAQRRIDQQMRHVRRRAARRARRAA